MLAREKAPAGPEPGLLPLAEKIVRQGAERGEFRPGLAQEEIVRAFAMWERAQLYDWCLCGGDYSLVAYAEKMTPLFWRVSESENKSYFLFFKYSIFL